MKTIDFIFILVITVVMGFLFGAAIGDQMRRDDIRKEVITQKLGNWTINPETGEKRFTSQFKSIER